MPDVLSGLGCGGDALATLMGLDAEGLPVGVDPALPALAWSERGWWCFSRDGELVTLASKSLVLLAAPLNILLKPLVNKRNQ